MKTSGEQWIAWSQNFPPEYRVWFAEERKYLRSSIPPGSTVLEVGCGDGRSIRDLQGIAGAIVGIDHDASAVDIARKNFSGDDTVDILLADASSIPFDDGNFDFVICMTTFANFGDQKHTILQEMKRVLREDGKIIISVFSEDALPVRLRLYKRANEKIESIDERGNVVFEGERPDNVSEQFTAEELRNIFAEAELNVDDISSLEIAHLCTLSK